MNTLSRTVAINDTANLPVVGLGTYLIPNEQAAGIVRQAIGVGYRHIDTASGYQNEAGVGEGVRAALADNGLSRDDIFVTTKAWPGNAAWGQSPLTYDGIVEAAHKSLEKLGTDYIDLYLIHAPFGNEERLNQWRAMVDLKDKGVVRAIGVSNFNESHLEEIKAAGLPMPEVNQLELHPWSQKPGLIEFMKDNLILPVAYSSLVPLSTWRTEEGQDSAKTDAMTTAGASASSPFKAMAQKYGVSEAQVLLRWALQMGYPVIPKSVQLQRMQQNLDLFGFEIDAADMELMAAMDKGDGVAWSTGDPSK